MPQLYLFLVALIAIVSIVAHRNYVFTREKQAKFEEEVATKVDELQKVRHKEVQEERFKEVYVKEIMKKKYDFTQYKLIVRKADMAIAKKQWNEAKKMLIQSLTQTKDELVVSLKLASVYLESGDLKRAEALYRKLLEIDPGNPDIYENLGKIYVKKKHYKDAVQAYVLGIELDDKDDKKLVSLGRLYHLLMRPSLAAECYKRAAELKPREVHYLFLLADACKEAEDYENALFTYERILTMEPYNEQARVGAQDVRIRMNEIEKALSR